MCSRVGKSVLGSVLGRDVGLTRESLAHRPRSVNFLRAQWGTCGGFRAGGALLTLAVLNLAHGRGSVLLAPGDSRVSCLSHHVLPHLEGLPVCPRWPLLLLLHL